ncbi:SDR family NAD(P)-dependent oxidoreductase [Klenkia sp. PcliD-1-E]|uniref:SDR family NAD(P)-dependent oxidoreductase n=1 Tax=Klenkia sp. PcliD-1-E TaxID=2954492 RepID=UPI0020983F2C|nr:SDR family NAD(P)-dependent oxidoreductase [Klenkia sp. PcliD-1-E]MCO7219585.1 SDR family oxidoreductase [Klenkia sp. PcliD-1-E]
MSTVATPLSGRTVLVTGGGSGIGAGAAVVLAARGARVLVADLDPGTAEATTAAVVEAGGRGEALRVDVADVASVDALFAGLRERGVLADGLVNSAGVTSRHAFTDTPDAEWDRVLGVNLTGTRAVTQRFARELIAQGSGGAVVNVASVMAHFAAPNLTSYVASKGGVGVLTRATALELAPHAIRVNAVSPGYIETGMTRRAFAVPRFRDAVLARTPAGRFGTPEDVGRVIAFLLSDDADYVTGQLLPVDGGMTTGDASLASPSADELAAVGP